MCKSKCNGLCKKSVNDFNIDIALSSIELELALNKFAMCKNNNELVDVIKEERSSSLSNTDNEMILSTIDNQSKEMKNNLRLLDISVANDNLLTELNNSSF